MHTVETDLLGRDREGHAVDDLRARAAEGGGAMVVRGDAGLGKSALLGHAAVTASARGVRLLRAVGVRTEANLPFAGLHQVLRPVLGSIDDLPGPQRLALAAAFGL